MPPRTANTHAHHCWAVVAWLAAVSTEKLVMGVELEGACRRRRARRSTDARPDREAQPGERAGKAGGPSWLIILMRMGAGRPSDVFAGDCPEVGLPAGVVPDDGPVGAGGRDVSPVGAVGAGLLAALDGLGAGGAHERRRARREQQRPSLRTVRACRATVPQTSPNGVGGGTLPLAAEARGEVVLQRLADRGHAQVWVRRSPSTSMVRSTAVTSWPSASSPPSWWPGRCAGRSPCPWRSR